MRVGLFAVLMACSAASGSPVLVAEHEEDPQEAVSEAPQSAVVVPEEPAPPAEPARVVFHDLLADRGTSFSPEGGLRVDLGGPAGAGTTLGGWGTNVVEGVVDDQGCAIARSTVARLIVSTDDSESSQELSVRLRSFVPTPVTVYWDGEVLGHIDATTTFATQSFTLESDARAAGDHLLMFRSRRRGRHEGERASLAVDWIELEAPDARPSFEQTEAGRHAKLEAGWNLRADALVPEDATLALSGEGELHVRVEADGMSPFEQTGTADIDLTAFASRVVRVSVRSEGEGSVSALQIETNPRDVRSLGRPRHVLLILIDTLRADKLSPYAPDTRVQTPQLAEFVRGATTFGHAHSQENWTKPSVATLLTSLMPWEHTATQHESVLPRSVEMLPEVLQDEGFQTASFICNGFVSDRFGFRQGWDSYRNYIREGRRTRSQFVAADVLEWLDGRDEEKPFFLYVHTIDPHVPYRPPNEILSLYGDVDYRGPINFRRDSTLLENVKLGNLRLNNRDRAHLQALYDGEITYHDRHFGSIIDGLRSRGLLDDTMVVITSDHGEEFWDHGSVGHGHSVYEELLHVPLFVRMPGDLPQRVESPVGLIDIMPTILEALGQDVPERLSGRSFLGELTGRERAREQGAGGTVSGFMENWRAFSVGRWKLIERPRGRSAIYDLQEDPSEQSAIRDYPITQRALRRWMGQRLVETASRSRSNGTRPQNTRIDAETAAQLRALGYIQ
ncbi:MAG: sulfatase [Polyangiales bacterium]